MLNFATHCVPYYRTGLALFALTLFLFALALPPFQAGIWIQTEPVLLGLYMLTGTCAAWLLAGMVNGWLTLHRPHLLGLCLLLWVGWQLVTAVVAVTPYRAWFGSPELGEGAGWHVALLLLLLTASPLWRDTQARRALIYMAWASVLLQMMLHWLYPLSDDNRYIPGSWTPAVYPSYIAFMAGYLWLVSATQGMLHTPRGRAIMALLVLLALYASHNVSGKVLLGGAVVVTLLVQTLWRFRPVRRALYPARRLRVAAMLCCLLPLGWYGVSAYFTQLRPYTDATEAFALLSDQDGSLGSRIVLNQIGLSAMRHEPLRWLTGNGWGGFTDDVFRYVLVGDVSVFSNGERRPSTMMVDSHTFHSHSQPLEALLALGLPGMVLWFAVLLLLLWYLPARYFWACAPMLVGLVALSFMWFELAQCVPYRALALAAVYMLCARHYRMKAGPHLRRWYLAGLLCGVMAMGWSAWEQKQAIAYGRDVRIAAHALPFEDYSKTWIESDLRRGGDRLRNSITFHAVWLSAKKQTSSLDDNDRGWYAKFMDIAHNASLARRTTARVAMLDVWMKYNLLANLDDPAFALLQPEAVRTLPDSVLQLARIAPLRDDIATALLLNLPAVTYGDEDKQIAILNRLLVIAPDHRGALWVLGDLLGHTPEHAPQGRQMQQKAVKLGVERIYPIMDEVISGYK